QADQRSPPFGADLAEREGKKNGEDHQRQDVAIGRGSEHIVGDHALEELSDPRERRRRLLLHAGKRRLQPGRGQMRQRKQMRKQQRPDRTEHRRERADDDDAQHGAAGDAPTERGLGALGAADHRQGDDQRDDRHLEGVEPQGADEPGDCEQIAPRTFGQAHRHRAEREPDQQRSERIISAKCTAAGRLAQRGFRNLKMKRSVLPRIFGSKTGRVWASAGLRRMSLVPTSWKPARLKSAFTTLGSMRWYFSTVARVSSLALATWSSTPTIATRFIAE